MRRGLDLFFKVAGVLLFALFTVVVVMAIGIALTPSVR